MKTRIKIVVFVSIVAILMPKYFTVLDAVAETIAKSGRYVVTKVYDGDTIHVKPVDGTGVIKVRLLGVDTPEGSKHKDASRRNECYNGEAKKYLEQRILSKVVRLTSGNDDVDPFGRKLAYVYLSGVDMNHELIKKGFAYTYPSADPKILRRYVDSERQARIKRLGLWGVCLK